MKGSEAMSAETEIHEISSPEDLLDYKFKIEQGAFEPEDGIKVIEHRLIRDIDMTGVEWSPINARPNHPNNCRVTMLLNGQGHSIFGLHSRPLIVASYNEILPCTAADRTRLTRRFARAAGLLYLAQNNILVKDLAVQGTLDLGGVDRKCYMLLSVGGVSGIVNAGSAVISCMAETDVILPSGDDARVIKRYLRAGGITGANMGHIVDCVYSGNLAQDVPDVRTAGIAFYNAGLIKNSYTEPGLYHEVWPGNYSRSKNECRYAEIEVGMLDNTELYAPGKPYYTGSLKDLFRSEMLRNMAVNDIFLGNPLKEAYWNRDVTGELIMVLEALVEEGAEFGESEDGAAALSVSPFRDSVGRNNLKKDIQHCRGKYSLMLDRLVTESPSFRKAILDEYRKDPDGVLSTVSNYVTSRKRTETILKKAEKYQAYSDAIKADEEFIDTYYER